MALHEKNMRVALEMAGKACKLGEVPVGAALFSARGKLLARECNRPIGLCDPTAHAEILALRKAASMTGNYRLTGCMLYVTIEPCAMCAGALVHARVARLVIGAMDPKSGACGSLFNIVSDERLNHRVEVISGVLEAECQGLIREFFKKKRQPAINQCGEVPKRS